MSGSQMEDSLMEMGVGLNKAVVNWTYYGLLVDGIEADVPEISGPSCFNAQSLHHRLTESLLGVLVFGLEAWVMWGRLRFPASYAPRPHSAALRRAVLLTLTFIYGVEVGYKFATQQMIYLLYPCHLLNVLQMILLVIPHDNWFSCLLFRISVYSLNGPLTALIAPTTDTLLLPLEAEWYFVQHWAIVLMPLYLASFGGAYSVEGLWDLAWPFFKTGLMMLYYLIPMQIVALSTGINVSMVLCPVKGDPFHGPWWKTVAFFHQHLMIPLFGKLAVALVCLIYGFPFQGQDEKSPDEVEYADPPLVDEKKSE